MSNLQTNKELFSFRLILLQFFISFVILLIFSGYLWLLQNKYDEIKTGYAKAFFYSLLIFGAGFSYDCAKRIFFLDKPTFIKFAKKFLKRSIQIFVIILLCFISAFFLTFDFTTVGQIFYIGALGFGWFAIKSIMDTIEAGSK
jgi:hypothetical protein